MSKFLKTIFYTLFIVIILLFTSCTTTKMTISPKSFHSTVDNINMEIYFLDNGYQLTGSGSETKNELKVTGQSHTEYAGYGTLLDNEYSTYDNYMYTDSTGKTIEFIIKYKRNKDYNEKECIYDIEVVRCFCDDKKAYNSVCGQNGIVKKIEQLSPDQESVFFDRGKTIVGGVFAGLGVGLLATLILLSL